MKKLSRMIALSMGEWASLYAHEGFDVIGALNRIYALHSNRF